MAFVGEAAEEVQERMVELRGVCDGRRPASDTECPSFVASVAEAAVEVQDRMVELRGICDGRRPWTIHRDWARMLCEPFLPVRRMLCEQFLPVRRRVVRWVVTLFEVTLPPTFIKKYISNTTDGVLRLRARHHQ